MAGGAKRCAALAAVLAVLVFAGCVETPRVVEPADGPMMINTVVLGHANVSVKDTVSGRMVRLGWVPVNESLNGWTLVKEFDWQGYEPKE